MKPKENESLLQLIRHSFIQKLSYNKLRGLSKSLGMEFNVLNLYRWRCISGYLYDSFEKVNHDHDQFMQLIRRAAPFITNRSIQRFYKEGKFSLSSELDHLQCNLNGVNWKEWKRRNVDIPNFKKMVGIDDVLKNSKLWMRKTLSNYPLPCRVYHFIQNFQWYGKSMKTLWECFREPYQCLNQCEFEKLFNNLKPKSILKNPCPSIDFYDWKTNFPIKLKPKTLEEAILKFYNQSFTKTWEVFQQWISAYPTIQSDEDQFKVLSQSLQCNRYIDFHAMGTKNPRRVMEIFMEYFPWYYVGKFNEIQSLAKQQFGIPKSVFQMYFKNLKTKFLESRLDRFVKDYQYWWKSNEEDMIKFANYVYQIPMKMKINGDETNLKSEIHHRLKSYQPLRILDLVNQYHEHIHLSTEEMDDIITKRFQINLSNVNYLFHSIFHWLYCLRIRLTIHQILE